jgi:demethylmenaquinone methyltransferase / 2-methoxy-6-polyprenyl-1,4-benzoquinol methylase
LSETNLSSSGYGLKDDWASVQRTLEEVIPVYDRTNRYISLGSDLKLRTRGIELLVSSFNNSSFSLLDLGCGTGTMTRIYGEKKAAPELVTLVDPILQMMRVARVRTGCDGLLAVYEALPFRDGSLDSSMAGFSLRDARDLSVALREIYRLLKPGGKFLIVDLSKPDSVVKNRLIAVYWRGIAPLIAFLSSGKLGLKFGALSKTYRRLPKISEFLKVTKEAGFEVSRTEFSMLGGASVILLNKKSGMQDRLTS